MTGRATIPWISGKNFAAAHNKKLRGAAATKAKEIANAMIRGGADEGLAIATANKKGNQMMRPALKYSHKTSR